MTAKDRLALELAYKALFAIACRNDPDTREEMIDFAHSATRAIVELVPRLEQQH
jgi:hypothetical protein